MGSQLLEQVVAGEAPGIVPISVEQYQSMIRVGILEEGAPIELIDGILVWKDRSGAGDNSMVQFPRHAVVITLLSDLLRDWCKSANHHVRVQLPVMLSATDAPEPDVAVIRGSPRDFATRHPGSQDLCVVVEVADTSLAFDRSTKQKLYASAGIPLYWIVNLPDELIEVYESPSVAESRYQQTRTYARGQAINLSVDGTPLNLATDAVFT
jgi:Uma2 family endonuclease